MAYTLAQLAKVETQPLRKGIILNMLRVSRALEVVPWENVNSLQSIAVRYRTLPTGGAWRTIGGSYTESTNGDVEQITESVYIFGAELKFDRIFGKIGNTIVDPKVLQTEMKTKAMTLQLNEMLIDGDHATTPDAFEGLKKRVSNMPSTQTVYFAASNAAALDPTASVANANVFFSKLEEIYYKCKPKPSAIFTNEGMQWGLGRVARYVNFNGGGAFDLTKDSFDRDIPTYKGVPLIDMGLKADQSTEIIPDNETAGDGGTDATSLYAVAFGTDEGLTGIQLSEMEVYDPLGGSELPTAPATMTRIEWPVGLANFGSFCIVRGRNVEGASEW